MLEIVTLHVSYVRIDVWILVSGVLELWVGYVGYGDWCAVIDIFDRQDRVNIVLRWSEHVRTCIERGLYGVLHADKLAEEHTHSLPLLKHGNVPVVDSNVRG